jgi:hypothetical protein
VKVIEDVVSETEEVVGSVLLDENDSTVTVD